MSNKGPQIIERLDFVAKRITGLKVLQLSQNNEQCCILACDAYFVEVRLDQSMQFVKDVLVRHETNTDNPSPCPVLKKVLVAQDYETFAKHLLGLHSIYSISTNDKKVKQRAYPTLTALETDLSILYEHQRRRINNCHDLVHKSPLGIMEPRKGGLPVKLTYFITPYDLINPVQREIITLTPNNIIDQNIGLSATVEIEGSSPHKLQNKSLISTQHNSSLPSWAPFNSQNSEKLPAQFALKLSQPFPMLNSSINQIINEITEPATIKEYLTTITANSKESLISLIARQELDLNKGPFCRVVDPLKLNGESCDPLKHAYTVKLLEQVHLYHILDHYFERQDGVYLTKIPFTHPTSIPTILKVLRQQALFNFVIGSCIRRNKNQPSGTGASHSQTSTNMTVNNIVASNSANLINCNFKINMSTTDENSSTEIVNEATNIFDVIPVNLNTICVSFEHPSKESLATLEIDIKELTCQLYALDKESVCTNEYATKVFQKCWSIPITVRSVLRKCDERRIALLEDANKRRERELQELLASNSSQQVTTQQFKPSQQQTTLLKSKINNLNDKSKPRDLNSIAEYLSSKANQNSGVINFSNQNPANTDANADTDSRSNLLKKFSCKPKAKQNNNAAKNQTGNNKILSLMLKRQNSTSSASEDATLKATISKKAKTKITPETGVKNFTPGLSTTKLISPEVANAARLANQAKQSKQQNSTGPNISVSLIRSPNKSQNHVPTAASGNTVAVGVSFTSNAKNQEASVLGLNSTNAITPKGKSNQQVNGGNIGGLILNNNNNNNNSINNAPGKPRKSSIGAVLDRICGGVAPVGEQGILANNQSPGSAAGAKVKAHAPKDDQFAIKQGSSDGLKLTVTKTKPTGSPLNTSSTQPIPSAASSATTPSNPASITNSTTPQTIAASSSVSALSGSTTQSSKQTIDTNKILGLGSSAPTIKYTIPKISKTQPASQSSQPNAPDNNNSNSSGSDSNSRGDEPTNSNSSVSGNAASSSSGATNASAANKRVLSTPFGRPNNSNRNPVSSSTHPPNRTTSNPLAGASSRPSFTTNNKDGEGNLLNRISSTNQGQRQLMTNRIVNLQQQSIGQRPLNSNNLQVPQQSSSQQTPLFALGLNQPSAFASTTDINLLAASQAALLNQQRSQQQLQKQAAQQQLNLNLPGSSTTMPLGPIIMTSTVDASLISSTKPQFAAGLTQQPLNPMSQLNNLIGNNPTSSGAPVSNITDSLQLPSTSVINVAPQFYVKQPIFEESVPQSIPQVNQPVSSLPRHISGEVTQSSSTPSSASELDSMIKMQQQAVAQVAAAATASSSMNAPILNYHARPAGESLGAQAMSSSSTSVAGQPIASASSQAVASSKLSLGNVSSSSDKKNDEVGPAISTPSSPTECSQVEVTQPPPLIPIDSLEEPQATSPSELPDDASDRLSIVDMNENNADGNSVAGTPKASSANSPLAPQSHDSNPDCSVGASTL